MKSLLILMLLLIVSGFFGQVQAQNPDLMRQAQIQRLITALEIKDYQKAYEIIQGLRNSGMTISGELLYYEALSALSLGDYWGAFYQAEAYIEEGGSEAKFYASALEIYATAAEGWDARILGNSFINFNQDNLLVLNHRFSGSNEDLFLEQLERSNIWRRNYLNQGNGIISTYSVNKKNDGVYNLIRLDWLACPIGTTFVTGGMTSHPCIGEPTRVMNHNAVSVADRFEFLGLDDWRVPHQVHFKFDRSHKPIHGPESGSVEMLRYNNRDRSDRTSQINQFRALPHFHSLHGASERMHGALLAFYPRNNLPCVEHDYLYCDRGTSSNLLLIRGPYIVKQSKEVDCFETDLASRGDFYSTDSGLIHPSKTLCEFHDEKGSLYFLNNHYGANAFDPELTAELSAKEMEASEGEGAASSQVVVEASSGGAIGSLVGDELAQAIGSEASGSSDDQRGVQSAASVVDGSDHGQAGSEGDTELRDVILYREARMVNSGASYQVSWQGQRLGVLSNGTALRVRLPPGQQSLTIGYRSNALREFELPVTVEEEGETYLFFRMKFAFGENPRSHMTVEAVPPATGQAAVAKLGR